MEKLIELFREYVNKYSNDTKIDGVERTIIDDGHAFIYWTREYTYLYIISKQFWFIERLIDSDKIDNTWWNASLELYHTSYTMYESMLMLLAISDNPIEDLISYLN